MTSIITHRELLVLHQVEHVKDNKHDIQVVGGLKLSSFLDRRKHRLKVQVDICKPALNLVHLLGQLHSSGRQYRSQSFGQLLSGFFRGQIKEDLKGFLEQLVTDFALAFDYLFDEVGDGLDAKEE